MPGFGEQMRQISLKFAHRDPLAAGGVIRFRAAPAAGADHQPGQPKATGNAEGLRGAGAAACGRHLAAVPYYIDLIGGPLHRNPQALQAFRPSADSRKVELIL
jgi:molybdopterin adenylyltransferase